MTAIKTVTVTRRGETIALPITEGVEYKRVDEAVAASIL